MFSVVTGGGRDVSHQCWLVNKYPGPASYIHHAADSIVFCHRAISISHLYCYAPQISCVFFPCVYDVRSILYPLQPSVHQHIVLSVQDVLNIVSSDPVSSLCTFSPSISLLIKFRIRTQDQDLPMLVSRYFCLWLFPTILLIHVIEIVGKAIFFFTEARPQLWESLVYAAVRQMFF